MTKFEAISNIISDSRATKASVSSYRRLLRAGKALELTEDEQKALEVRLDYRDTNGNLYKLFTSEGK